MPHPNRFSLRPLPAALSLVVTLLLSGCGGGGGGGTDTAAASGTAATTPSGGTSTSSDSNAASGSSSAGSTGTAGDTSAAADTNGNTASSSSTDPAIPTEALAAATAETQASAMAAKAAQAVEAEARAQILAAGSGGVSEGISLPSSLGVTSPAVVVDVPSDTSGLGALLGATAVTSAATSTAASTVPQLTVRARADVAGGVGAMMAVRVDGNTLGSVEVKATTFTDFRFSALGLKPGAKVDVVYSNDGSVGGIDRNLYVAYLSDGATVVPPTMTGAVVDKGVGTKAYDGLDTIAGQGGLYWNAALRLTWPTSPTVDAQWNRKVDAVRFLQQASFGPTQADVDTLVSTSYSSWIANQMAIAYAPHYLNHVQAKYALGDAYRPKGASYNAMWPAQKFWERSARAPDQLRQRVAFALHQIFMVSLADSNLYWQGRAYAAYVDLLNKNAFGNYRQLMEDMALSPAMGIYLSHMRNRKEDVATGRMPDENFARELMQLFTIGLYELNADGSLKRDASGNPIETYNNADVMAMAKVFTGWSWAYPDAQLTDSVFRWSSPSTTAANDQKIDYLPMKAYPGQHSTVEKKLFSGKAWATTLPAGNSAQADLKGALDTLFNHPNVGPFIGRQLIQKLVTSSPSAAYVGRVAAVFNNNGQGVRGDLTAVVRAILLDTEARNAPASGAGKLREPVLRVAQWMRALGATSTSGEYQLQWALDDQAQRALAAPSVFGYFRPGYIPANTAFSSRSATAPEFQIVNESSVAAWINMAEAMAGSGLGWTGSAADVVPNFSAQVALANGSNLVALPDQLNLLLLGGRMTSALRQQIIDTMGGISGSASDTATNRARAAVFLTLASPEFVFQP